MVIGKFCAIAAETKFIMTGDHKLDAISTYPFPIFQKGWETVYDVANLPVRGDIIIGNDVWLGYDSLIKNGVTIGDGSIIAARAVVVKDVPPYAVVAGNPGKVVKLRFDEATIQRLLNIAWWNWDIQKINNNLPLIAYRRNKAPISTSIPASLLIFHPIITYPLKNIVFYSTAHAHFHSLITLFLIARRASFCRSIQHQIVSHYL